jgi:hypothetical protein
LAPKALAGNDLNRLEFSRLFPKPIAAKIDTVSWAVGVFAHQGPVDGA